MARFAPRGGREMSLHPRAGKRARKCPARSRRRRLRRDFFGYRRAPERPQDAVIRHALAFRQAQHFADPLLQLVSRRSPRASAASSCDLLAAVNEKTVREFSSADLPVRRTPQRLVLLDRQLRLGLRVGDAA